MGGGPAPRTPPPRPRPAPRPSLGTPRGLQTVNDPVARRDRRRGLSSATATRLMRLGSRDRRTSDERTLCQPGLLARARTTPMAVLSRRQGRPRTGSRRRRRASPPNGTRSLQALADRTSELTRSPRHDVTGAGRVRKPPTRIPTIAAAVSSGVDMNEWVHESSECSGTGSEPYTDAQFEGTAQLIAVASKATGLPVNRSTVVVHADINTFSRRSDSWPRRHGRPGSRGHRPGERDPEATDHHGHRRGMRHLSEIAVAHKRTLKARQYVGGTRS